MGREKWDRHEKICQSLFSLSSSRERSELSTLLLGSYKQPTTQKEKTGTDSIFGEKSRPWEELEEEREEREEERGGERRERERERRERERVGREKWDRHEKDLSVPIFAFVFS